MKIIRLSTFLDYGGIETKMVNLSAVDDPDNIWIFCAIGKGGVASQRILNNGKKVICFDYPHKIPSIATIYKLYLFFRLEKPSVVHTSGAEANFHGIIAAKLAGIKTVIGEEIGIPSQSKIGITIFTYLYKYCDFVLGESKLVVENLRKTFKVDPSKLKVVSNFIENKSSTEVPKNVATPFTLITVSRLVNVKNIKGVLRCIHSLKSKGFVLRFVILGSGEEEFNLKSLSRELLIEDSVEFLGHVENPEIELNKADLFILNSFSEGFSNSLLEAMAYGIPSLSTATGGAVELIKHQHNGWLVEPSNDLQLLTNLEFILKMDKEHLQRIGIAGRDSVRANFSLERHKNQLMSIYN